MELYLTDNNLVDHLKEFHIFNESILVKMRPFFPLLNKQELSVLDYMTLRDLVNLYQLADDLPLIILLILLFKNLSEGSLCLSLDKKSLMGHFPNEILKEGERLLDSFFGSFSSGKYSKIISHEEKPDLPLVVSDLNAPPLLYFLRYYLHETNLKLRFLSLLDDGAVNPAANPQKIQNIRTR